MTTLACRLCNAGLDHGVACRTCVGALATDLRALWAADGVHGLATDLDITITRQGRFAPSPGGRSRGEAPLPLNIDASDVRADLHATLAAWCRVILTTHGGTTPTNTIPAMARFLHSQADTIRTAEWGDQAVDELRDAVRRARRAVDRPTERVFAGACPTCGMPVYDVAGRVAARCRTPRCGGTIPNVAARREASLRAAKLAASDRHLSVAEAAMAARALDRPVTERGIRKAIAEGRIVPVAVRPRMLVRLGDVLALKGRKAQVA